MLRELKRLFQETVVYGLSTVVGRLLNILLLPIYTHCLAPGDYGIVATIFSYIAFLNVLYGHGMDFAFMRHSEPSKGGRPSPHFSAAFWSLAAVSLALSAAIHLLAGPLSAAAGIPAALSDVARYGAWILAFDAMTLVPFAELRMSRRAGAYAGIKVANIVMNLVLNYIFLARLRMGVRGVFLASLITSCATLTILAPVILSQLEFSFDAAIHRRLLRFALPLVPAGLASMMVQVIDRPILKFLTDDATVGIYQANYRLGVFMMLAVNMFDAAWRPFFIQKAGEDNARAVLGMVLTYFVLAASGLFLFVSLFIPHIVSLPILMGKPLIHPAYWGGLSIVPVVTLGYLFNGIYVNMLAAPTLAKRSGLVAYATGLGALVNVGANFLLIPRWGMMGAAAATLAAYAAMSAGLFALGRGIYRVDYEWKRLAHMGLCLLSVGLLAAYGGIGMKADRVLARLVLLAGFPALLALTGFFNESELSTLRDWASGAWGRGRKRQG